MLAVLLLICAALSLASPDFLTLVNFTSLLNNNAVNVIWAVGLLVVLIAGGIDISFAVAASVALLLQSHTLWVLSLVFSQPAKSQL